MLAPLHSPESDPLSPVSVHPLPENAPWPTPPPLVIRTPAPTRSLTGSAHAQPISSHTLPRSSSTPTSSSRSKPRYAHAPPGPSRTQPHIAEPPHSRLSAIRAPLPQSSPPRALLAIVGAIAAFLALFCFLLIVWSLNNKRRNNKKKQFSVSPNASKPGDSSHSFPPATDNWGWRSMGGRAQFGYEELAVATNWFSRENLIGEGGFGLVYKGTLVDGQVVAVKMLKPMENSRQAERQFQAEVEVISRVHHRNLVALLGYCIVGEQRLLVYEYVPNGTLHNHLHGMGGEGIKWVTRVKVAIGAARGLAYLHEDCHPQIIHCDIKSSNILLDCNFNARVSDFGLAKLVSDSYGHVTTHLVGTFGYLAPDYALTGKLTEKSDVYAFGVLLLELLTGRKPIDTSRTPGNESLVEWARPLLDRVISERNFEVLADPRLGSSFDREEMLCVMEVAAACLQLSARRRPRMGQVVRMLENDESCFDHGESDVVTSDRQDSVQNLAFAKIFQMMAVGDHQNLSQYTIGCSSQVYNSFNCQNSDDSPKLRSTGM
ncbi:proline-rich receptor-like protein kinase PERK8 isoform X2 [Amborella trichopoda]|uniref:non-specific serine/threonine protein kinase n=1 Tax=Amborella trichopoda TaxID=13333 RepID=W1NJK9_AMBTC|nr:proline-rich receptor-like protein kinase PERK8 isoform X2 [Amborella trichopoda]ERM95419.1 hypothetical protein AMTR_s00008p00241640 [Amborella trichopoda]|eukprot:XP_011626816.2 proline-rich receptor-like protein kinase PERK8 isoform X2 [Amborella trichopoda]